MCQSGPALPLQDECRTAGIVLHPSGNAAPADIGQRTPASGRSSHGTRSRSMLHGRRNPDAMHRRIFQ